MSKFITPVVAIPPAYNEYEQLEILSTLEYLRYLYRHGARCIMSTAGTSQFNLLNPKEIIKFNVALMQFQGTKILGIPPLASRDVDVFLDGIKDTYNKEDCNFIALYPDRYYSDVCIEDYVKRICDKLQHSIYLHTQKMRSGRGGDWNYNSDFVNNLYDEDLITGIKEEHPNLQESYNFIRGLYSGIQVIVAGGSMRRFSFLESAGADTFLSGIGNFYPWVENSFRAAKKNKKKKMFLELEARFFDVFMKHGWHSSLRAGLKSKRLTCHYDRQPWPSLHDGYQEIKDILSEIENFKGNDYE